jgi:cyclophilin family peptidyl-prolyl cis-trans isomerase
MATPPAHEIDDSATYEVTIATDKGDIVLELDPNLAPNTVNNFVALVRRGFYDNVTFHRVVPSFVIQGGDPEGSGRGGPGYTFADEPVRGEYTHGAVAMANAGPDTNGSQFFICIDNCTTKLDKAYNLFGYVTSGLDVTERITQGDVMRSVTVAEKPAA